MAKLLKVVAEATKSIYRARLLRDNVPANPQQLLTALSVLVVVTRIDPDGQLRMDRGPSPVRDVVSFLGCSKSSM